MKKYILYGVGVEAEKFLCANLSIYEEIAFCIDANRTGSFHGIPIYSFDAAPLSSDYKILVTPRWDVYTEIRTFLESKGLQEFSDFIWSGYFKKKFVVVNANCHGIWIRDYLNSSAYFKEKYCFAPVPPIYENKNGKIPEILLHNCDIYIHQDIQASNSFSYYLSDEYVIPQLKAECKIITIPNLVGFGTWLYPMQGKLYFIPNTFISTVYENFILEEAYSTGLRRISDIESYYMNYKYDPNMLTSLFEKSINKIRDRELHWDIKISDYILKNYKNSLLFIDRDHPYIPLVTFFCSAVAKLLNITDAKLNFGDTGLSAPIPPSVRKHFELAFEHNYKYINTINGQTISCFADYVKYYFLMTHDIILEDD